jgi:hypothetical protein
MSWWDQDRDRSRDSSRPRSYRDRNSDRDRDQYFSPDEQRRSSSGWESTERHRSGGNYWEERERDREEQRRQQHQQSVRGGYQYKRPPLAPSSPLSQYRAGRLDDYDYIREDSRRESAANFTAHDLPPPPPPPPLPPPPQSSSIDTARRNSVSALSIARPQDPTHSSPRERGMLDSSAHRRQSSLNTSSLGWNRGKEGPRGDIEGSRRSSSDRNTDRSSIASSPKSCAPLASPDTSVSAGMGPHQPADGRLALLNAPVDAKSPSFSR